MLISFKVMNWKWFIGTLILIGLMLIVLVNYL